MVQPNINVFHVHRATISTITNVGQSNVQDQHICLFRANVCVSLVSSDVIFVVHHSSATFAHLAFTFIRDGAT